MENSSSSFTPFAKLYPDAKRIVTCGSTCDSYVVRRYGKLHFVKRLKPTLAKDPRYIAALQKEFEVGYNLEHSNIVRYESVGNDYIVIDYVDGRTLRDVIDNEPDYFKDWKNLDKFVSQLLSAVAYMHTHGVVHLDLKPDNIMLTNVANDVKIVDLGFCYTDSYNDTMGRTDKYSAPEQTDGSGHVDVRTDIFTIGRILQQIPYLPHIYSKVAERCTRTGKEERFQSVGDIAKCIRRYHANRRRMAVVSIGLIVILLVSTAVWLFVPHSSVRTASVPDTVYVAQPIAINSNSKADTAQSNNNVEVASDKPTSQTTAVLTATDSLQRFRNELSIAVQEVYKSTLYPYRDSSYESHTSEGFARMANKLKNLSHDTALRLSKKYPTISSEQIEQMWYNEINGILGSVGQAMLRNDGRIQ